MTEYMLHVTYERANGATSRQTYGPFAERDNAEKTIAALADTNSDIRGIRLAETEEGEA